MCTKKEAEEILGEVYAGCRDILPIKDAYLYGSYARGDYHQDSDVDIFLTTTLSMQEIEDLRRRISHVASELSMEHDVVVSVCVRPADVVIPEKNFYYANVLREGLRYPQSEV